MKQQKRNVVSCNANILLFNQICIKINLIPKYDNIKIPNTHPAAKYSLILKLISQLLIQVLIQVCMYDTFMGFILIF